MPSPEAELHLPLVSSPPPEKASIKKRIKKDVKKSANRRATKKSAATTQTATAKRSKPVRHQATILKRHPK